MARGARAAGPARRPLARLLPEPSPERAVSGDAQAQRAWPNRAGAMGVEQRHVGEGAASGACWAGRGGAALRRRVG